MPNTRAILQFQCHALHGMAYGFTQPTVLAHAEVAVQPGTSWTAFDEFVASQMSEPVPVEGEPQDEGERLLWRLMHVHAVVQREVQLPVFGTGRIVGVQAGAAPGSIAAQLALPSHEAAATNRALEWAWQCCDAMTAGHPRDGHAALQAALAKCREDLRAYALGGINSFHFLRVAHDAGIPVTRVLPDVFAFGQGRHNRLLRSTITDATSSIGVTIAHSKIATAHLLRRHGVPVPRHKLARTVDEALDIAAALGYPVVVKPDDQEQGRGVSANLADPDSVRAAFASASALSRKVLVEKHHRGDDYRLTVFQDEVVKVLHRRPGGVVGDGVHDVAQLVRLEQQGPRMQRVLRERGAYSISLDQEALGLIAQQGLAPDSVPGKGRFVALRRKANVSAGGIQRLVPLADCHPDNLALAVRATQALRLDLCGVDLLIPDIATSWRESGAVIVELNAQPQIGWYHGPEAYGIVLKRLLRDRWNIPLHLALFDKSSLPGHPQQLAALFAGCGCNAYSTPRGAWIDGERVTAEVTNGLHAAGALLVNTAVKSAGIVMTIDEVRQRGLPAPRFDRIMLLKPGAVSDEDGRRWAEAEAMVAGHAKEGGIAQQA